MILELGNFKYDGERFFINDKYVKFSRLRYSIMKILCDNYNKKPVSVNKLLEAMYHDIDDRREEPQSQSYRIILHMLKKFLHKSTDNCVSIKSNNGLGYSIEYEEKPRTVCKVVLSKKDIEQILKRHQSGTKATTLASEFKVSKHRIYDILLRSKQDKSLKQVFGENYDKKRFN